MPVESRIGDSTGNGRDDLGQVQREWVRRASTCSSRTTFLRSALPVDVLVTLWSVG
ncbi:hypothetical protein [Nonomuraea sp. KM90]|uniref:hypothetical protein n=1 Tax=Nonomuraea sp. KM90 TaxID=3457428 RepID=UPI003FCCC36E